MRQRLHAQIVQFDMYFFLIFLTRLLQVQSASVNITSTWFLRDPDVITSSNNDFKLGFFSPPNSTNRFVGIWYNMGSDSLEVVWVANRDNPLKDSSGVLRLSDDGNLQVLYEQNKTFCSSNSSHDNASASLVAQLQDTGNLFVLSTVGGIIIWQSFEHPTDSVLPNMRIGAHDNTNNTLDFIRSWKSPSDPSSGRFTVGVAPSRRLFEFFIWDNGQPYWRTGPWSGSVFIGIPSMYYSVLIQSFSLENDNKGWPTLAYSSSNHDLVERYVLTYDGLVLYKVWNENISEWDIEWRSVESECDVYGKCGPFASCNPGGSPICSCLRGFKPTNNEEWGNGNWTSGCSRRTPLQCGSRTENQDKFLKLQNMKVPDHAEWLTLNDEGDCQRWCQAQCSCLAFAYYLGIGCMTWNRTLIDIQEFNTTAVDLFIRLAHSELAGDHQKPSLSSLK